MHLMVIEYDQASGYEGICAMDDAFKAGWETLEPLKYFSCCGIYRTTLYKAG